MSVLRLFRKILWGFFFLILIAMVASKLLSMMWGVDSSQLSFSGEKYQFVAVRDEASGVFQVQVEDEESLWFAMGYVIGWDREFQTNLLRAAARGELSSLLGPRFINNDRLMRHLLIAAQAEMNSLSEDNLMRRAARAYARGRNEVLNEEDLALPIEYKMMGLERSDFREWSEEDVFALARFHSWSLSYDFKNEQTLLGLKAILGKEKLSAMLPMDKGQGPSFYGQDFFKKKGFKKYKASVGGAELDSIVIPSDATVKVLETSSVLKSREGSQASKSTSGRLDFLEREDFAAAAERGASNAWVMLNPKIGRGLTLCNDTHLRLSWPSPLYPMSYRLKGRVSATGFAMPGTPALVIGSFSSPSGENLVLGITSGTLADNQDLVALTKTDTLKGRSEVFEIYEADSGRRYSESHDLLWSDFGPVINEIFPDWIELIDERGQVALDSVLLRENSSPMEFFVRRNLFLGKDLVSEIHQKIAFPVLNLFWIHESTTQEQKFGHILTGDIWTRNVAQRSSISLPLSKDMDRIRSVSHSSEREYFETVVSGKDEFFVANANQQVWPQARLSFSRADETGAYMWANALRTQRINDQTRENWQELGYSQTDFYSPSLHKFYQQSRQLLDANRLCSESPFGQLECLEFMGELDSFDGVAQANAWQTSVIALWHAHFKWQSISLLNTKEKSDEEFSSLVKYWQNRRGFTHPIVHELLEEGDLQRDWELWTAQDVPSVLLESFRYAVGQLSENYSNQWRFWNWGNLHRISWLHPIALAPEPIGTLFHDGVLGPSIGVSGALNSPGRFEYDWSPKEPLKFSATHGGATRFCAEFVDGNVEMFWSSPSGPSGNPFSEHSKEWTLDSYFQGTLTPAALDWELSEAIQ